MRRTHSLTDVMASTTTQTMRRHTMKGDGEDTATTGMKAPELGQSIENPTNQSQEWELSYRDLQGRQYCSLLVQLHASLCDTRKLHIKSLIFDWTHMTCLMPCLSSLPLSSGTPMSSSRSKRPNRRSAASMELGRFVAAMTTTCTKNCCN